MFVRSSCRAIMSGLMLAVSPTSAVLATSELHTKWMEEYNGPGDSEDEARAVAVDLQGNVYCTGYSIGDATGADYATLRYDSVGNLIWEQRYNGPGNSSDKAVALAIDDWGGVYVTGFSGGDTSGLDYLTLKYDTSGTLIWERRYNGSGNSADGPNDLKLDSEGNVYVTGSSFGLGTGLDFLTLKYNTEGTLLWARQYDFGSEGAAALHVDEFENVYVTGSGLGEEFYEYVTVKYDSSGAEAWVRRYAVSGNVENYANDVTVDQEGNVIVTGFTDQEIHDPLDYDYCTVKYDSSGNLLWERTYHCGVGDQAHAVATDNVGNIFVTGGPCGTLKYDPMGNLLWAQPYPYTSSALVIRLEENGNCYVAGDGYYVLVYSNDGDLLWTGQRENGGFCYSLDVFASGAIATTGRSSSDYATGVFTTCHCPSQGDIEPDGFITSLDLAAVIDALFAAGENPRDPVCPTYRFDLDCDAFTTSLDLSLIIDYLFVSGSGPCDPCVQ
jgi:hypothetical protein